MTSIPSSGATDRYATTSNDIILLLGRILLGWIFVRSGYAKIADLGPFSASLARDGLPLTQFIGPLAAAVEFFGGLALIFGLKVRYAAVFLILFVVIATGGGEDASLVAFALEGPAKAGHHLGPGGRQ